MHLNRLPLSILFIAALLITSCRSGNKPTGEFTFLDNIGIEVTEKLLLHDTLAVPDIYRSDKKQKLSDLKGESLSHDQYEALVVPAGKAFADEMSNWLLLGVRDIGQGNTLAAYYACSGAGYSVELMTYDRQGRVLDAINAREQHMLWRTHLGDISNDTIFTLDGYFTFNGNHLTLHRTMGLSIMDWDNDCKGEPIWLQQWDQQYLINDQGHFVLQGQQVVKEQGEVDQYAALDFKSWDMLVCSLHDPGIMDTWNGYTELVNSTYDPDYQYNPFPWDVAQLYKMNPQRFLLWMAAKREAGNLLLPQFKLSPDDRPALLDEIGRLDNASDRQWLSALVNSWDDQPLTKHL